VPLQVAVLDSAIAPPIRYHEPEPNVRFKRSEMVKNQAIVIGINQYRFLQPLRYAQRDAELMRDFLVNQAGFEKVFFFSDDASGNSSTEPFRVNLLRVLRQEFKKPFMGAGDNFWFFFSMPANY
jgi:uncharacterized caspase-like protein